MDLPAYRSWYRYGLRSPSILLHRLRNKYALIYRLRMAWQRARRGYDDSDIWNLDSSIASLIVVGCRGLREQALGYPNEFSDNGGWDAWEDILRRIQEGFQAYLDEGGFFYNEPEQEAKFKDAMSLLSHWFGGLWN